MAAVFALLLTTAATAVPACAGSVVAAVDRDGDATAPYVLTTAAGARVRLYGQDFIDPRQWRRGDRLTICRDATTPDAVQITDETRGETLAGRELAKASGEPPLQVFAGPAFNRLLASVGSMCPQSQIRWVTAAQLLDFEDSFVEQLPRRSRRRFQRAALTSCADRDGASCPTMAELRQIEAAGLLPRFTRAVCVRGRADWH
ncbi:MAG: hypothetical protein JF593_13835 [Novosphingobium sp.]|nr:hypothetical protein [Novosphingobium sp.]